MAISFLFAQRCVRLEQPVNHADLAAFALPDGEIPTLCAGKADSEGAQHEQSCKVCEVCATSTNPQIAHHDTGLRAPLVFTETVVAIPEDARGTARVPDNVRSRAPPELRSLTS